MTIMKISSRNLPVRRRTLIQGGMATILATGLAPGIAKAAPIKLVMAHLNAVPESAAVAFDWQALLSVRGKLDYMLSGGLTPANVAEAIRLTGASAVDVSSGVERRRGEKDIELIRSFLRAAKTAKQAR